MADENHDLIINILRNIQIDISNLKKDLRNTRSDMREGFSSIRTHMQAYQKDHIFFENRLISVEDELDRLKRRTDLADDPDA